METCVKESEQLQDSSIIKKDSVRSWVVCLFVGINLAMAAGLLVGSVSVFFVYLLDEFGQSKETTGEKSRNFSLVSRERLKLVQCKKQKQKMRTRFFL